MDRFWSEIGTIAAGIIGIALLAVLVAPRAKTSEVIGAAGSAFSGALNAATAPVSGFGL